MYTLLIFVTGMFVYTYISLHTVYRRGWIRTFVKTTVFLAVFIHFTGHCGCAAHYAAVLALRDTLTL